MKTSLKLIISAINALLFLGVVNAQPAGKGNAGNGNGNGNGNGHGGGAGTRSLTPEARQVVLEALAGTEGEYAAHALYSAVLAKFGDVQPYAAIREAEMRHIRALTNQLTKYGVPVPADPYAGKVAAPATLMAAAQGGVDAEIKNIAMFDRFMVVVKNYPDLTQVFTNLRRASKDAHLPAFRTALKTGGYTRSASRR